MDNVGKPSTQRCTKEIQDQRWQRYAYERLVEERIVKNGRGYVVWLLILVNNHWIMMIMIVITHYGKLIVVFPAEYHVFACVEGLFYSLG
jgi:hypothetical protein